MRFPLGILVLVGASCALGGCGDDDSGAAKTPGPRPEWGGPGALPAWAKASPEQVAEAHRLGVPAGFENEAGIRMVLIPGGTFTMGSPTDQGEPNEHPEIQVALSPFYLAIHETTNAQYRTWRPKHDSGKPFNQDQQPVVMVNHSQATSFVGWLSERDMKRSYTLPTEAQWEYACRAGTRTSYATGTSLTTEQATLRESRGDNTTTVGTYQPNAWGLFDMHGNVWEWVRDSYEAKRYMDPSSGYKNPVHLASDKGDRVIRGGSWMVDAALSRSAYRGKYPPSGLFGALGFRVAMAVPAK